MRTHRLVKTAAALGAAVLLLTGCNALGGGDDSNGGNSDGGGDRAESVYPGVTQAEVYGAMTSWGTGCEIFEDLQPYQDYIGVEEVVEGGMVPNNEGELPACRGQFHLPGSANARAQLTLLPFETDQEAADEYQSLVDGFEPGDGGTEYTDVQEGELGGEWTESYFWSGYTEFGQTVNSWGQQGNWVIEFFTYVDNDPGGEDAPVYNFTLDEYAPFVTEEYLPGLNSEIAAKFEE
ncbi:hypothetical protein [Glycomyces buryatensis]|uniref:Lipoprotein n=1 Tax=Glycomyces buryatensis TaxID=2570927 RepID=A0A4S8QD25_9ACTN|nr:hypothetical protein [Glycomyces buryatensis]THV40795.1 hypothetical protein FAB82_14190 [Glycomyces buryatensis]